MKFHNKTSKKICVWVYNQGDSTELIPRWKKEIKAGKSASYKPSSKDTREYRAYVRGTFGGRQVNHRIYHLHDADQWINVVPDGANDFRITKGLTTNPEHWMRQLAPKIQGKRLGDIVIPGTHGSGSFSWHNTSPVRNQDLAFADQLKRGIRFFDLRVTDSTDSPALGFTKNTFYLTHDGISATNQKLVPQLQAVSAFAQSHPKEIIILDFHRLLEGIYAIPDKASDMSQDAKDRLAECVKDIFSGQLIESASSSTLDLTISSIWSTGKNVLVRQFVDPKNQPQLEIFYDEHPVGNKITHLKTYLDKKLKSYNRPNRNALVSVGCNIWSLNILASSRTLNAHVVRWLTEWHNDAARRGNLNIVVVDFFENDAFVITILKLNRKG